MSIVAVLAALALLQDPVQPASGAPISEQDPPAVELEDVIVERRRLEDLSRTFVDEVGAPASRRGLARWRSRVCVGVAGIRQDVAQHIVDHVSRVAMKFDVTPGDPGCRPNVLVVFSQQAGALSNALVEGRPRAFHLGVGGLDRGNAALRAFRESDRPVRWWHVSMPTNAFTGGPGIRMPGELPPYVVGEGIVNKGRWVRDDLNKVIIVVDGDKVDGVGLPQLADYISMVALAQVDPDGDTSGYSSILNLFDAPDASTGLTGWDTAYLDALYSGPSERISNGDQRWQMLRNLRLARAAENDTGG
ncbi:MAG TPA: hypothetical protein VGB60_01895 [Brevundimonas sp.]|jgi:hypothetical protein|uniref:hypothetical protein n=1 Tax=Brevundimonas sp. TaxID=1871086 RepID=UPI002EDBA92F